MRTPPEPSRKDWLLPLLAGEMIGTSYIPFPPWASLFCFVPLWLFWQRQASLGRVVLGGVLTSFVFTLIGFNWVTYLLHEFAHLNWLVAGLGMVAFALLAHLFVPLAGAVWFLGRRALGWSERLSIGMMALITTLSEAYSPTLFDWNFGYSWYAAGVPLFHWAEFVGFSGLSAATLLCNWPLFYAWRNRRNRRGRILLGAVAAAFVVMNLGGLALARRLPPPDASVSVLLVQGNIGNAEKMAAELGNAYQGSILRRYLELTDQAVKAQTTPVDFAIWPETAFPAFLGQDIKPSEYQVELAEQLRRLGLPLITGAYGVDRASRRLTNALFTLDRSGRLVPPHYAKSVLLAFGEYIPGESLFPGLRDWLPPIGEFARGSGPTTLLKLDGYRIGPQICYESLFPAFTRALADLGAQFIVNATNDSWYGSWQEPYQHLYMTLARSVEFRRPVLRSTNTGISTAALATGEVLALSPLHERWAGIYSVPYRRHPESTFYQTYFYLVPSLLWATLAGALIWGIYLASRRR
jgi:apolipoprotein N-acyltransferase